MLTGTPLLTAPSAGPEDVTNTCTQDDVSGGTVMVNKDVLNVGGIFYDYPNVLFAVPGYPILAPPVL